MFCTKCGAQIESDAKFCPVCGTATQGTPAPQTVARPATVNAGTIADKLRAFAAKNQIILLVALGCTFLSVLMSFIRDVDVSGFGVTALLSAAISAVPAVAVLLLYLECQKTGKFDTLGFKIIKIYSWVLIGLVAFAGIVLIVGSEIVTDVVGKYGLEKLMDEAGAIFTVAIIIVVALVAGYQYVIIHYCSKMEKAILNNARPSIGSALTVILWIVGILNAISIANGGNGVVVISNIASAVGTLCYALLCGKATKELAN